MTDTEPRKPASLPIKIVHYALVLTVVCVASGAGLTAFYEANDEDIALNDAKAFLTKLAEVAGTAEGVEEYGEYADDVAADARIYVRALDGGAVRYIAAGETKGYQSQIRVLVAVDADAPDTPVGDDPVIAAVAVVSSQETPGLGENIKAVKPSVSLWGKLGGEKEEPRRPEFQTQFDGKKKSEIAIDMTGNAGIKPVTAATISSRAVCRAVTGAVDKIIQATTPADDDAVEAPDEPVEPTADATTEATSWEP